MKCSEMSEEQSSRNPKRNISLDSSNSSELSLKRIKEELSMNSNVSVSGNQEVDNISTGPPSPCAFSTPIAKMASKIDQETLDSIDDIIKRRLDEQKNSIIADLREKFQGDIETLEGKVHDLEVKNDDLTKRVETLEKCLETQQDAKTHAVNNDQYARRSHMVIHGLPEGGEQENIVENLIDVVKDKLKIALKRDDLDVTHRLGTTIGTKPRPVITVFKHRDKKMDIMRARKSLKGSGVTFTDDMCRDMRTLLAKVKSHALIASSWSWNGKIFGKDKSGTIHTIRFGTEWWSKLKDTPT